MSIKKAKTLGILVSDIKKTFRRVEYPGDHNIVFENIHDDLEREEIKTAFKNKRWEDLSLDFVVYNHAALFFFSAAAFRYYLPAYLIYSVTQYYHADKVPGAVINSLTMSPSKREPFLLRISTFNEEQKKIVRDFLVFMDQEHKEDYPVFGPAKALSSYWNDYDSNLGSHT